MVLVQVEHISVEWLTESWSVVVESDKDVWIRESESEADMYTEFASW